MKDIIKSERISYKTEPLNWFSYYAVPLMLLAFGILHLTTFKTNYDDNTINFITGVLPIILGSIFLIIQRKKLNYKIINTDKSNEEIRIELRKNLNEAGWEINHDTKYFIYATLRKKGMYLGAISFRTSNNKIKYNLDNRCVVEPFQAFLSINFAAKKFIKKLRAVHNTG